MRAAADRFLALGTQDAARGVFAAADALRDAETREMYEREEQRAEWCQAPTASDAEGRAR